MNFGKAMFAGALAIGSGAGAAQAQVAVHATVQGTRVGGITCPSFASPCANNGGSVRPFGGDFGISYDFRDLGRARLGVDLRGETLVANKRGDASAGGGGIDRHYNLMGGVRGSFRTHYSFVRPYVELLGGYDHNNDTGLYTDTTTTLTVNSSTAATQTTVTTARTYNPNVYSNYGLIKGLAGVDLRLASFLDLRAVELGYGEMFGSAVNRQTVAVQQVATVGVVNGVATTTSFTSTTSSPVAVSSGTSTHSVLSIGAGVVFRFGR